jgi:hypothetical protein
MDNRVFWALGRAMMEKAPTLKNDKKCNDWARVGELLTTLGSPFAPKSFGALPATERAIAKAAYEELEQQALTR